jgi:hypothetical protein
VRRTSDGEYTVNRKQLLVVALVVGLLLIGWMLGHSSYELNRQMTLSWELDPSEADVPHPSAQPADSTLEVTVGCAGPLSWPDERLDVRSPGMATVGFDPWRAVYLEPNPCTAERAARRHKLELGAVAILLLGLVGLVAFRPRSDTSSPAPSERAAA